MNCLISLRWIVSIPLGADYVERGSLEELPDRARNVVRLFNGQVMLVMKGSIWNDASQTYNGPHDTGTHLEVRKVIQEISDKLAAAQLIAT